MKLSMVVQHPNEATVAIVQLAEPLERAKPASNGNGCSSQASADAWSDRGAVGSGEAMRKNHQQVKPS